MNTQSILTRIINLITLNNQKSFRENIHTILDVLKEETGYDALGIRLKNKEDFPYYATKGFSNDFLLTENSLTAKDHDGCPCRDTEGTLKLECTCGLVISGKTDPTHPLFTSGGSFWTNNSFPILELPVDQDPRLSPRNRCIHEGYAAFALIPLRVNDAIIGLLQLNSKTKNVFTLDLIQFFETIGKLIGAILTRKQAEDEKMEYLNQNHQLSLKQKKIEGIISVGGTLCHEINQPLTVITGYVEILLLRLTPEQADIRERILKIQQETTRIADITNKLNSILLKKEFVEKEYLDDGTGRQILDIHK